MYLKLDQESVIKKIHKWLFLLSLLPLLFNWLLGFFFIKTEKEKNFIYKNAFASIGFIFISSFVYLIYMIVFDFISNVLVLNYVFFLLQSLICFLYCLLSVLFYWSYYKNKNFLFLEKLDYFYKKFIEIL